MLGGIAAFAIGMGARAYFGRETTPTAPSVAKAPADAAVAIADAQPSPDAAPARAEHAAWKLVDNRHAVHRFVGGAPVLDGGDVGFARYTRFGKPHEFHMYDGAGHAFLNFMNAERYRETQAKDAWEKMLAFLGKHMPAK